MCHIGGLSVLEYYVYMYVRNNGVPYYVGMGKKNRAYHKHMRGRQTFTPTDVNRIVIAETKLTQVGAWAIERRLIRWWGRKKDGGTLINIHPGGPSYAPAGDDHYSRVNPPSREIIDKRAAALRGVPKSASHRANISKGRRGIVFTDQQVEKIRQARLGTTQSDHTKQKRIATMSTLKWYNNGITSCRCATDPGDGWTPGRKRWKT